MLFIKGKESKWEWWHERCYVVDESGAQHSATLSGVPPAAVQVTFKFTKLVVAASSTILTLSMQYVNLYSYFYLLNGCFCILFLKMTFNFVK